MLGSSRQSAVISLRAQSICGRMDVGVPMPLDIDYELRLALFEHIGRLASEGGGRITSAQLDKGMVFRDERVAIWNRQQGIHRPKELRDFGAALTIQTSFNSPYDDRQSGPNGTLLYRYRGTDPNQSNNVALRHAMELKRPLLYLVAVEPGVFEPIFPRYVDGEQPQTHAFAIRVDPPGQPVFVDEGAGSTDVAQKAYATREVLQRLHQQRFRYLVLKAYQVQCAVCRIRVPISARGGPHSSGPRQTEPPRGAKRSRPLQDPSWCL